MSTFLLLTVLVFSAEPRAAASGHDAADRSCKEAPAPAAKVGEANVRRLVEQLGDADFQAREAATRALRALGEKVLASLRAAKNSPDLEVQRRVARLLGPLEARARRREIEAIKKSKLAPREKGRKLMTFISKEMSASKVESILGNSSCIVYLNLAQGYEAHYKEFGLKVKFSGVNVFGPSFQVERVDLVSN
jgi:hypothetical protein